MSKEPQTKKEQEVQEAALDVAEAPAFAVPLQILRGVSAVVFVLACSICVHTTQLVGWPIRFFNKNVYHAWIDITKQSFGIFLTALIQYWTPVTVTIRGDAEMAQLFAKDELGNLISKFGDKAILMSNHQLYVDWAYMWWVAFSAKAHGGVFIILKASLKWLPIWGWGMQFYRFIFLSRKWQNDEKVLKDGLDVITQDKDWPSWLFLFPEGTTMSKDGVEKTNAYAKKTDLTAPKHCMLPRARGLRYSLLELNTTIEYLYDVTIYYDGVPAGEFGEDYYTLRAMYLRGNYPKKVDMYWRRYKISEIPYKDEKEFEKWIQDRWYEKDEMLDRFMTHGVWTNGSEMEAIDVNVQLRSMLELFQIFSVPINVVLVLVLMKNHLLPLLGF